LNTISIFSLTVGLLSSLSAVFLASSVYLYRVFAKQRSLLASSLEKDSEQAQRILSLAEKLEEEETEKADLLIQLDRSRSELQTEKTDRAVLENQLTNERKANVEKEQLLATARAELSTQFKNVASEILDEKSKKFAEQNQTSLTSIIAPLKETLNKFDKQILTARGEDAADRQKLRSHLDQIQNLGLALTSSAENLTNALKGDNKAQGNWGEMVLEKLLENSGLVKDRE